MIAFVKWVIEDKTLELFLNNGSINDYIFTGNNVMITKNKNARVWI